MAAKDPGQQFVERLGQPPEQAQFFWMGGPVEVAPRTYFASAFSGVTGFETDAGVVLVDTGLSRLAPNLAAQLRSRTNAPIHTAIYTHGHVDHAFGLTPFLLPDQEPPRVVAHRNVMARFDRYARTSHHNRALNARQFGGAVALGEGENFDTFKQPDHLPDVLFDDHLSLEIGGLTFELTHCRGETDDHAFVFCRERRVLCPGDLFIWGVPNAGNPQKAQRYPWEWADGLRRMAALGAQSLCPGHGGPVVANGPLIEQMLLETATFLDTIVERTLAALEAGSPPHVDIVTELELPRSESPWLQPVYDEAEFIVRNVLRYFGGWWSGRPSELKPAPRTEVARELCALAGGATALVARAQTLAASGELRAACHLMDYALEAAPDDADVRSAVADLYEARAERETSLMAINLFRSAANYARSGRPFR